MPISVDETDQDSVKTLVRIGLPKLSPFRYANEGVLPGKGQYEPRIISLATATSFWNCDQSIIRKNPRRGARYMEAEGQGILRANMLAMEEQFFYGNESLFANKKGFQGLTDFCGDDMVVDCGGEAENNLASIWFVWWNPLGVQWVYGQEGRVALSEPELVTVTDEKGGKFKAYEQSLEFYPGLKVLNSKACGRIANIPTNSVDSEAIAADVVTDLKIRRALMKFPVACRPNAIYMPAKVNLMLAASRSTVSISGQKGGAAILSAPAAPPDNFDGIPIIYTDQLSTQEPKWVPEAA